MQQEKEMYLLHSKMDIYKRHIKKAFNITRQALQQSKAPVVSFSGGKDSIVMLDILYKSGFKGEMVFFKYGICTEAETPKETLEIVEYYANAYHIPCHIIPCLGEFDCWEELGYFCIFPETAEEKRIFNQTNSDFRKKSAEFEKEHKCDVAFMGLRKEESKQRKITLLKKGEIYCTKSRKSITCCPIAGLTGMDIWAYIFSNHLKYPKFYDYPYQSRERIRNEPCLLYSDAIYRHGGAEIFKEIFPEYIAEIKKRYPNSKL